MTPDTRILAALCDGLKQVKKIKFAPEELEMSMYLGGDLGIDSIEMLEIWFHAEKQLGIRLPDEAKRDVYTIGQVVEVLRHHTSSGPGTENTDV